MNIFALFALVSEAVAILRQVDPSKNFSGNKDLFEAGSEKLLAHWKPAYDAATTSQDRSRILNEAGKYLADLLLWLDDDLGWDFPNKEDRWEDYILRVYAFTKARAVLSGVMRMYLPAV